MSGRLAWARALVDRELRQSSAGPGALGGEIVAALAAAGLLRDDESRHEVQCPGCGATIRARMADAPDDQDDDAHVLSEPRPSPKPDARGFWIVSCTCGYVTSPNPSAMRAREAAGDHLRAKTMTDADDQGDDAETTEATSSSSVSVPVTATPPQSGIDTCRHQQAPRVHPRYEIQESGHAPED